MSAPHQHQQRATRAAAASGALLCALLAAPPSARAQEAGLVAAIEAADISKFADFVAWPADVEAAPGPFTICVVGDGPIADVLGHVVQGQAVRGHGIVVQAYASISGNPGCRTLYAEGSPAQSVSQILDVVNGLPILTVTSNLSTATTPHAMINFALRDNRVRFEVDDAQAAADGLTISSKLLGLAVSVIQRPTP